jgi:tRNA(Ile)-lysidine synthase
MLENIADILQHKCKLQPDDLLLVGVSGGPDSLSLMHVLHQLGYQIIVVHVDHNLRPQSDSEAVKVKEFADQISSQFIACQADIKNYSDEYAISVEEAARILRYQILFEQARIHHAKSVVVGHNADDQVETILMHLLRGTGLAGLTGMDYRLLPNSWSNDIPLIRPLLSTWRSEIKGYLDQNSLVPLTDFSNLDTSFFRNRIRHDLLPFLEGYNPAIRQILLRLGTISRDDYSLLQQITNDAWRTTLLHQGEGLLAFDIEGFLALPTSIKRLLLRKAIGYHIPGLRDVEFNCVERGLVFLADNKPGSQLEVILGVHLHIERGRYWLATWDADLAGSEFPKIFPGITLELSIPSTILLNDSWKLEVIDEIDLVSSQEQCRDNCDPYQAWVDIGKIGTPLSVRARVSGDRMKPLGMNGHSVKISDLMINLKLPEWARVSWPIVCSGEEIIWVPGLRLSESVRLTKDTQRTIHLRLFRD